MEPINEKSRSGFEGMKNPHRNNEQSAVDNSQLTDKQRQFNEQTARELSMRKEQHEYNNLVAQLNAAPKGQEVQAVSPLRRNAPGGQPTSASRR